MKNYVCTSREMADRLRDAGYPYQEINGENNGFYWAKVCNEGPMIYSGGELWQYDSCDIQRHTYAPTATELLPDGWYLARQKDFAGGGMPPFFCGPIDAHCEPFFNENPHDAAAEARLYVNAQT